MKWFIGIISFFAFIFMLLLILPFMVDFYKFKPQIQSLVAEKLNAKINFKSARLTIFSGLGIEIKDVSIENTDEVFMGTEFFKVKDIKFKTELFPLIKGKFIGSIEIKNPEIILMRGSGKTNVTTLLKKDSTTKPSSEISAQEENANRSPDGTKNYAKFTDKIMIKSFEIKNATFYLYNISGPKEHLVARIENTNLTISDIGSGKDTKLNFSTEIDYSEEDVTANGIISLSLLVNTELSGLEWKNSLFNGKLSFDKLAVNYRNAFVKKKSVPFHLNFAGMANPKHLNIDDFKLSLQAIDTNAKVSVSLLDKLNSNIAFNLKSNNLAQLGELLPQHKEMLLNASLDFMGNIDGNLLKPDLLMTNFVLKSKLSDSDINLIFNSNSLKPLVGNLKIQSKNLYLAKIIKPFLKKETDSKAETEKNNATSSQESSSAQNDSTKSNTDEFKLDAKQKKLLFGSNFSTEITIGKLVYDHFNLTNLTLNSKIQNYNLTLDKLSMNLFSGSLISNASVDLASHPVFHHGNVFLQGIKIQELYKSIKPDEKVSPIEGTTDIKMNYNAKGMGKAALAKYLNAKGTFLFNDGVINSKSLMSLAGSQLNNFMNSSAFSQFKMDNNSLKKMSLSDDKDSKKSLKNQKGDFEVRNGKLLIKNTINNEQGLLKLDAEVGVLDETLSGTAFYVASNTVKTQLLQQSSYVKYLLNEKGEFELLLNLTGTVSQPEVTIQTDPLQKRLLKNASKEVTTKIKEEIKKNPEVQKLQDEAKKLLEKNGLDLNKLGF